MNLWLIAGLFILGPVILLRLVWQFSPFSRTPQQRVWKPYQIVTLIVMALGGVAFIAAPLWLAPPHFQDTPIVYLALLVLWYPVLLVCAFFRPSNVTLSSLVGLLIIGYIVGFIGLALGGPRVSVWAFEPADCQQESADNGQVRYICKHNFSFGVASTYDRYILIGPQGSPIVWISSAEHGDYP